MTSWPESGENERVWPIDGVWAGRSEDGFYPAGTAEWL